MKATLTVLLAVVAVLGVGAAVYMSDIDQTHETRLPDVTVPDVDVSMEETTVTPPANDG
ncbi:MAG: hypothetical protein AB3N09_05425 [Tateyamaria sp.]